MDAFTYLYRCQDSSENWQEGKLNCHVNDVQALIEFANLVNAQNINHW